MPKRQTRQQLASHIGKLISNDRNATHGDPHIQFECAQELKAVIWKYLGKTERALSLVEAEVVEMTCTKLSRITCGSNNIDHFLDIAGYNIIAAEGTQQK